MLLCEKKTCYKTPNWREEKQLEEIRKTLKKQRFLNTSWFVSRIKENQKTEKLPTAVFLSTHFSNALSHETTRLTYTLQNREKELLPHPLASPRTLLNRTQRLPTSPQAQSTLLFRSVPVSSIKQSSGSALSPDRHDPERVGLSLSSLVVIELTRIVKRWEDFHQRSHIFHHTRTYVSKHWNWLLAIVTLSWMMTHTRSSIIHGPRCAFLSSATRRFPRKEFRFLPISIFSSEGLFSTDAIKTRRRLFHHPSTHCGECSPRDVVTFSTYRF